MQFDSFYFFLTAPAVVLVSYLVPGKFRNWFFLLLSLLFCYTFTKTAVLVLAGFIALTYGFSLILEKKKSRPVLILAWILIGAVLVIYRLADPLTNTLFHLPLPVSFAGAIGLSFYTLNALSYLSDLCGGKIEHRLSFVETALFLSFFPTVTSGPLLRAGEFAEEMRKEKPLSYEAVRDGFLILLVGYVMKLVIAGRCALLVSSVYGNETLRGFPVVLAVIFYSLEIYTDFAGYSLIAKGLARAFGFEIPDNFRQPYFSSSIKEFWRRWHISLSSWLRDYVYIPCGGSHGSRLFKYRNLIITFLVSGFWHGRGLTFLVWGLLHALFQIVEDVITSKKKTKPSWSFGAAVLTFVLVSIAWVFFQSDSVSGALSVLLRCLSIEHYGDIFTPMISSWGLDARNWCFLVIGLLIITAIDAKEYASSSVKEWFLSLSRPLQLILVWGLVLLVLFSLNLSGTEFIYMQF